MISSQSFKGIEKVAKTVKGREVARRLLGLSDPGGVGSFFVPSIDSAENRIMAAAAGDRGNFSDEHPYWTLTGKTLLGSALGAIGGGIAGNIAGGKLSDALDVGGGRGRATMMGAGLGSLVGVLAGGIKATKDRRDRFHALKQLLEERGIDEGAVTDALRERDPSTLKGVLAPLVMYPAYGSHHSNEAQAARALLGKGESDAVNFENIGTAAGELVPYMGVLEPIAGGVGASRAKDVRKELGIEPA